VAGYVAAAPPIVAAVNFIIDLYEIQQIVLNKQAR
jgi:hypothetical protein